MALSQRHNRPNGACVVIFLDACGVWPCHAGDYEGYEGSNTLVQLAERAGG